MRPALVTDEQIIEVGQRLEKAQVNVSSWTIREQLGHGNLKRIEKIWSDFKGVNPDNTSTEILKTSHTLPREIEDSLSKFISRFTQEVRELINTSDQISNDTAELKSKSIYSRLEEENHNYQQQLKIASNTIEQTDLELERLQNIEEQLKFNDKKYTELDKKLAKLDVKAEGLENLLAERQKLVEEKTSQAVDLKRICEEYKRHFDKLKSMLTPEQLEKAELT